MLKYLNQFAYWRVAQDDAGDPELKKRIDDVTAKLKGLEESLESAYEWSTENDGGPYGYCDPIYQALSQLTATCDELTSLYKPNDKES